MMKPKFDNEVTVTVRSGKTNEVLFDTTKKNAISDDFLCPTQNIYQNGVHGTETPYCFLLPDGPNWNGFVYDRQNPWAPYCTSVNNYLDNSADPLWKSYSGADSGTYTPPFGILGTTQMFFQWSNLPADLELRGIGLTAVQSSNGNTGDIPDQWFGALTNVPVIFVPETLVILPSAILVHGRDGGLGTPDILQITYTLSVVGVS
jgi:hypothetical protein